MLIKNGLNEEMKVQDWYNLQLARFGVFSLICSKGKKIVRKNIKRVQQKIKQNWSCPAGAERHAPQN